MRQGGIFTRFQNTTRRRQVKAGVLSCNIMYQENEARLHSPYGLDLILSCPNSIKCTFLMMMTTTTTASDQEDDNDDDDDEGEKRLLFGFWLDGMVHVVICY